MSLDIRVPDDLWDGDEEAVLSRWLYRNGSMVEVGSVVAEVMVEKISFEILSPASGSLEVRLQEEEVVLKGAILGRVT